MARTLDDLPRVEWPLELSWTGTLPAYLAELSHIHGPIFVRHVAGGPTAGDYVFMVGPAANRFVLHTGRHHFSHAAGWTPILGEMLGRGLLNMDDPEHARHRQMWNPAFNTAYMEGYVPLIHQIIQDRTAAWPGAPEVDVYQEARDITFDAAAAALAGFERGPEVDRLRQLFYSLLHGAGIDSPDYETWLARVRPVQAELGQKLQARIAARRARPADQPPSDILDMMVRARDETGQALDDAQLLGHLNILLVAGHETTTTLGAWTLFLLAQMPEWRQRLRAELDAVLDEFGPQGGVDGFPVEALRRLPELDNFIKETGRLYPPVITIPRGVLSPYEFHGYRIPAGSQVRLSLAAGHLLPAVFADPVRFDPERFAPPRREDRETPYSLVTFGGGPRICIGINFANIEVRILAAHALRHFEWEIVPDRPAQHLGYWTAVVPDGLHLRFWSR